MRHEFNQSLVILSLLSKIKLKSTSLYRGTFPIIIAWQGRQDSNLRPSVLETDALAS